MESCLLGDAWSTGSRRFGGSVVPQAVSGLESVLSGLHDFRSWPTGLGSYLADLQIVIRLV
jgi:hypothetical protein